ncbi:MAG: glycosyltransferase [Chitinophagaceae bacterium]|nr:glycosyltransferase [Chitinophagaceae bacterium]MBP7109061.1 glycosyltransferase [Chitinophagaceae bacterium]MBP7314005.1 glycosyltransferase [Chitinophagaceae bacterium]
MERKKILWLCSWYPSKMDPFNGDFIQRHARAAALFNDIHVIHVTYDYPNDVENSGQELNSIGQLSEQIVYFKKKKSLKAKLTNQLRWLANYKKAIRNYIIKNGKPDLVHLHVPMKAGVLALWMKKNYKISYIVTEHWGIYNHIVEDKYASKSIAFKKYTKKIFERASKFISVSDYLAKGVNRQICKKDYVVIPNAVDTDLFYYKEKEASAFRFIHVSNMVPLKNAEGILRSFKNFIQQNINAELIMVGDIGPQIRDYAQTLSFPAGAIKFLGEIPYTQVAAEMQKADCLLLFSNIENSPCVIGEALCCGLPVITTNVGGIPELTSESNSLLIESKDEDALTQAMHEMVGGINNYNRKKIAENAISKFSYSVIGKQINTVYEEIIASKSQ